jgi:hypothetical protein
MKNFGNALLVSVGLIGLLGYGCSEDSDGDGGTGGTTSSGGKGGKGGSAGKATGGSAGKSATGGSSGKGGDSGASGEGGTGTSGAPGTGGSTAGGGGQPEAGGGGQGGDSGGMAIVLTDGMEWDVCETSSATYCTTWTWDASEEHFAFEAENGAVGTVTILENGSQLRMHRTDTVGPTEGFEGDYVGVYTGGNTVAGSANWYWPGGGLSGTFVATW